jgi:DNA-binding transcriptional LysR family regulator
MVEQLDGIAIFIAVAEEKGFRAAGRRLGISGSAVSQALRNMEERLGVALLHRTTRHVRLTEAGEQLYAAVRPALNDVESAIANVMELGTEPSGTLRLTVSSASERFLTGSLLGGFLLQYPKVHLELNVSEHPGEIVSGGYDAGVGLAETIEQDMIAMPVSGELRLIVVGAPSYFKNHPPPRHPRDLSKHVCINWRPGPESPPYRWEFTDNGHDITVSVDSRVVTNDPVLNIQLAVAGVGLNMAWESWTREHVEQGRLVVVLEEYSPPFPGLHLFYPRRRHATPALRALIDYVRRSGAKPA